MNNKKDDSYFLNKLNKDIDFIIEHTKNVTMDVLQRDEVLLDSMMFRLIQISENVKCLSDVFKAAHSEIPWTDISGLRNRLVHDYGNVDLMIVYSTVSQDIPILKKLLAGAGGSVRL